MCNHLSARKIVIGAEKYFDKAGVCKEVGYKRNETDSTKFYR